ncbi:MAG: glycosyltransferase family 2 protein [Actinomycetota bacterium]
MKTQNIYKPLITQEKVFARLDYLVFTILTIISYVIFGYIITIWIATGDWFRNPFTFWLLAIIFLVKLAVNQLRWWLLPFMTKPLLLPPRSGWRVGVVTTFVPGAEPIQMLEESVMAMMAMEYQHDTWVLDEGDDAEVKALCSRLGALHFSRKNLPNYQTPDGTFQARSKHGNYNSWLDHIGFDQYDIIAAFDPDHIPKSNFLTEVMGYFDDAKVGYVQAAQVYYNQQASFIARGAAEETYPYYSSNQMFCYTMGHPIVTGCHNTHRASALKQVGGFAAHDADDLLITLLYRSSGWNGVYIPKILAHGLTPVDWDGYFNQQLRWARSVLDVKFRIYPKLVGKLSYREKVVSFLHGFYYLQGATNLILLLLLAYMLATGFFPQGLNYFISINFLLSTAILILCNFYRQRFFLDRKNEWGLHWRASLLQSAKYPYLILALCQVVLNRRFPYLITSKVKGNPKTYKPFIPHLLVATLICAAWIVGIINGHQLPLLLHIAAALTIIGTLALTATGYMTFPAPYNPTLFSSTARQRASAEKLQV